MEGAVRFVVLMTILPFTMQEASEGACSCSVFAVPGIEPIMEHTLRYNVNCDQEGNEKCKQLCVALAESARDKAPALICEKLNMDVENLKVELYMKSCNMTFWTFTGLESTEPICCHEGKAVVCDEAMSIIEN
ncbi:uncharacterized protein [Linepithema humile]|uniref:uncharacterized protein n=1 Tax=Linepithema humile TaxID=83485 RepID=UPI00351EBBB7